jgi:hypothetical protein
MERVVEPELLDVLPAEDRRAEQSRADLRRVNSLMGHVRIMARLWRELRVPTGPCSLLELGAGDGTFCLGLVRRIGSCWKIKKVTLVDRLDAVSQGTQEAFIELDCAVEVVCQDVFGWLRCAPGSTITVVNLFLHHFGETDLKRLLALASERTDCFLACEPRRCAWSLGASRLLGLIGCNEVTRHDAVISVRAGFGGSELSALWPAPGWVVEERPAGLFTHCFAARRRHGTHLS